MVEFTGERVIPGQVDDDLWSEHVARYAFARRYAEGRLVLDAGCGTGYGSAELAQSATFVTGIDVAPEAIEFARANYPISNLRFIVGSCTAAPFAAASFDLVVAFEVIEHLSDFRAFLDECARVLMPQGLFIVSSPNKRYYTESRAGKGNIYHEHEFEAAEFRNELGRVFPHVQMLLQNRTECLAFHPAGTFSPVEARLDGGGGNADDANFFVAVCSRAVDLAPRSFVYVPRAVNLLREREQHIALLKKQLAQTQEWLKQTQDERQQLIEMFRKQKEELEVRNRWGEKLNAELEASGERVVQLQAELAAEQAAAAETAAAYEAKVAELDQENRAKTDWAVATEARLTEEMEEKCLELAECVRLLDTAEATVAERTHWAQRAETQRQELSAQLDMIRASRWLKLGRKLGVGPIVQ